MDSQNWLYRVLTLSRVCGTENISNLLLRSPPLNGMARDRREDQIFDDETDQNYGEQSCENIQNLHQILIFDAAMEAIDAVGYVLRAVPSLTPCATGKRCLAQPLLFESGQ